MTSLLDFIGRALHDVIEVTRANEARRIDFAREVEIEIEIEHAAIADAIARQDVEAARAAALLRMQASIRRISIAGNAHTEPAVTPPARAAADAG